MTDWIMILMLAVFGIIGYRLMGLIDRSIERHTSDSDQSEREKEPNEHAETGVPEDAHPGMPVLVHVQREGHSRGVKDRGGVPRDPDRPVC